MPQLLRFNANMPSPNAGLGRLYAGAQQNMDRVRQKEYDSRAMTEGVAGFAQGVGGGIIRAIEEPRALRAANARADAEMQRELSYKSALADMDEGRKRKSAEQFVTDAEAADATLKDDPFWKLTAPAMKSLALDPREGYSALNDYRKATADRKQKLLLEWQSRMQTGANNAITNDQAERRIEQRDRELDLREKDNAATAARRPRRFAEHTPEEQAAAIRGIQLTRPDLDTAEKVMAAIAASEMGQSALMKMPPGSDKQGMTEAELEAAVQREMQLHPGLKPETARAYILEREAGRVQMESANISGERRGVNWQNEPEVVQTQADIDVATDELRRAESALEKAEKAYDKVTGITSGATDAQIQAAEQKIQAAEAAVETASNNRAQALRNRRDAVRRATGGGAPRQGAAPQPTIVPSMPPNAVPRDHETGAEVQAAPTVDQVRAAIAELRAMGMTREQIKAELAKRGIQ